MSMLTLLFEFPRMGLSTALETLDENLTMIILSGQSWMAMSNYWILLQN
jgi:hypothetical protein